MKRKQKQITNEQKNELLKSPYIDKVYSNHIVYSTEFKQMAVEQYLSGQTPIQIFMNADLNLELIGSKNAFNLIKKWCKEKEKFPKYKSIEQEVKELREKVKYLEAVLEAEKKLNGRLD